MAARRLQYHGGADKGTIYRFMPRDNSELNKTWICDEGRFSFNYYQEKPL